MQVRARVLDVPTVLYQRYASLTKFYPEPFHIGLLGHYEKNENHSLDFECSVRDKIPFIMEHMDQLKAIESKTYQLS